MSQASQKRHQHRRKKTKVRDRRGFENRERGGIPAFSIFRNLNIPQANEIMEAVSDIAAGLPGVGVRGRDFEDLPSLSLVRMRDVEGLDVVKRLGSGALTERIRTNVRSLASPASFIRSNVGKFDTEVGNKMIAIAAVLDDEGDAFKNERGNIQAVLSECDNWMPIIFHEILPRVDLAFVPADTDDGVVQNLKYEISQTIPRKMHFHKATIHTP